MARLRHKVSETFSQARRKWRLPSATIWVLILAAGTVLGAVYLAQASQAAEMGRQVEQMKSVKEQLLRQNAKLEAEIAAVQDPARLSTRAAELGFKPAGAADLDYLTLPGEVGATVPASVGPDALPAPEGGVP